MGQEPLRQGLLRTVAARRRERGPLCRGIGRSCHLWHNDQIQFVVISICWRAKGFGFVFGYCSKERKSPMHPLFPFSGKPSILGKGPNVQMWKLSYLIIP